MSLYASAWERRGANLLVTAGWSKMESLLWKPKTLGLFSPYFIAFPEVRQSLSPYSQQIMADTKLMKSHTNYYTFHGLRISISGPPTVSATIHKRLRQFLTDGHDPIDLTFEFCCVPDYGTHLVERPLGRSRPVYKPLKVEIVYFDIENKLYINYVDRVRVLCDLNRGHARVSFLGSELDNLWFISHPMFTIPLTEFLKQRERYSLHAAGLCLDSKGLLIAGISGAGKSTLTIALLRTGFGFLSDDTVFLTRDREGLRMLAFPDEIDATDETIRLFPELHYLLQLPKRPGWPKRSIWAEEVYGVDFVRECSPSVLVFPSVANAEKSVFRPMGRDEALFELASNVLLTEPRASQSHLDVLGELIKKSKCYRLETGRDFDALPTLFRELVN